MLAFLGIVFATTLVAIQLAASQYSPRAVRVFVRSRLTKLSLGIFVATFVFSIVTLIAIRSADASGNGFTPGAVDDGSDAVGDRHAGRIPLLCQRHRAAPAGAVPRRTHCRRDAPCAHRGVSDRAPTCVDAAAADSTLPTVTIRAAHPACSMQSMSAASRCLPLNSTAGSSSRRRSAPTSRRVTHRRAPPRHGSHVDDRARRHLRRVPCVPVDLQRRSLLQDPGFGFRQLVDIAIRALSPAVNDPTTAVQVLDRLTDLLGRVADRTDPTGWYADDDGVTRVHLVPSSLRRAGDPGVRGGDPLRRRQPSSRSPFPRRLRRARRARGPHPTKASLTMRRLLEATTSELGIERVRRAQLGPRSPRTGLSIGPSVSRCAPGTGCC